MFPVLSTPSFFSPLLPPHLLRSCVISDTVKVEKPIPWVLSSVSLWGDILSGKPDTKANYHNAAEHAMSQRCKESPAGTQRGSLHAGKVSARGSHVNLDFMDTQEPRRKRRAKLKEDIACAKLPKRNELEGWGNRGARWRSRRKVEGSKATEEIHSDRL